MRELCDLVAQTHAKRKKTLSFLPSLVPSYQTHRASERRAFNANGAPRQSPDAFLLTLGTSACSLARGKSISLLGLSAPQRLLCITLESVFLKCNDLVGSAKNVLKVVLETSCESVFFFRSGQHIYFASLTEIGMAHQDKFLG